MNRSLLRTVVFLAIATVAHAAEALRVGIVERRDSGAALSEFLSSKGASVTDLSDPFERGEAIDLSKTDLLVIGSYATSDPGKRTAYRGMSAALRQFVNSGGTVAVLAQRAADVPAENWMPEPGRIVRTAGKSAKLTLRQPKHLLLNTPAKLAVADLNGWRVPARSTAAESAPDPITGWSEAALIVSSDDEGTPASGAIAEMQWGSGRAVFSSLPLDLAAATGNDTAKSAGARILENLLAFAATVRAGKAPAIETTPPPGYQFPVRGTVYLDRNADAVRNPDEPGQGGVAISDGFDVVLTNADGTFELANYNRDARFVFLHQSSSLKQTGDGFFRRLPNESNADARFDLPIQPLAEQSPAASVGARFVQLTDSHIRSVSDRNYMIEATSQIYAMDPPPDFVVATGDIVDAGLDEQFQNYIAGMQKPPVPYFNVFGNHEVIRGPLERYHRYIGPDYYSFERGGILFLALNCVLPTPRQTAWLTRTLELLGKDKPVVVFQHYPPDVKEMARFAGLKVKSVFSGHWHSEKEIEHSTVQSINSPTFIMGGIDASPAGFKIVRLARDGSAETEWRYGFQKQRLTIVSPQQGSPVSASTFPVVVNAYDTTRNVDSAKWRLGTDDAPLNSGGLIRDSATAWSGVATQAELKQGSYPFHVEVTDEKGATWSADQQIDTIAGPPAAPEPAGEWPMFMGDAAHTGYSSGMIATPLRLAWSVDSGGDPDLASPILANGRIYLAVKKRTLGRANGVAAFDPVTGKRLWFFATPNAINHTPAYSNGKLCAAEVGGRIYGIDAAKGEAVWQYDLIDARGRYSYCAPVALDGSFFAGVMRTFVSLRGNDGSVQWQQRLGEQDTDWLSSYGSPAVGGDHVAMSGRSKGGSLVVARRDTGAKVWDHAADGGMLGSPTFAGERILFCGTKSVIYCCNAADGKVLWKQTLGAAGSDANWSATTPAVKMTGEGAGIVVAGSGDGRMSALDLADAHILWTHVSDATIYKVSPYRRDNRPLLSSPTIAADKVFFGSADGHVYGLDLATGKTLWTFAVGVPVMSTPMVSGNALYVAAYDGRLYAFTAADKTATQ